MHELSFCEAVLRQVLGLVPPPDAPVIGRITLRIGPLAGVEPDLLRFAFPLVAAGTSCESAMIEIETTAVAIHCRICGERSLVRANRLLCGACGTWRVNCVSGDEMLLAHVEFLSPPSMNGSNADV
jgi:hydrogenase nickel incorporation protein HypA/HybF